MADNLQVTQGTGTTVAADEIGGVLHQRIKLVLGADGVNDGDVSSSNPIPTSNSLETSATGIITSVATAVTSFSILAANANRKGFIILNEGNSIVRIAFAATASTASTTLILAANQSYFSTQLPVYRGVISGISNNTNSTLRVTELT